MTALDKCRRIMPAEFNNALDRYQDAEEIRLRCGYPPSVLRHGKEEYFSNINVNEKHICHVIEVASGASLHAYSNTLAHAYINYQGLRIGICGHAQYVEKLQGYKKYSSLSIRLPQKILNPLPPHILDDLSGPLCSTLIIGPPGVGKTTALREIVKNISDKGVRVGLADERGELSHDIEMYSLGRCTDIISYMPKSKASILLLRNMNPQLIAMDEISSEEDVSAIFNICGCGTQLLATAHGEHLQDMMQRKKYKRLLEKEIFTKLLIISFENGKRNYSLERIN